MTLEQMISRLNNKFPNSQVQVYDLTGTQNHWEVHVSSRLFSGLTRIQQHKLVMEAFNEELKTGEVHALTMKTKELNNECH
jgi:stress-induced morphogen